MCLYTYICLTLSLRIFTLSFFFFNFLKNIYTFNRFTVGIPWTDTKIHYTYWILKMLFKDSLLLLLFLITTAILMKFYDPKYKHKIWRLHSKSACTILQKWSGFCCMFCCINMMLGEFFLWEPHCSFHMTELFWKFSCGTKCTVTENRNERWKLSDGSWFRTVPIHKWKFITATLQYGRNIKLTGTSSDKKDQFVNVGAEFIYLHKP